MIIPLRDVPAYERHLLFCSQLTPPHDPRKRKRAFRGPTPGDEHFPPQRQNTNDTESIGLATSVAAASARVGVA